MQPFDELVTARGGLLWRVGWLLTGDASRAEDLLGRALTRTWTRRHELDAAGGALEEHALAELARAAVPRRARDDRPPDRADWEAAASADWTVADPDAAGTRRELLESLAALTPRQRVATVLRHGEGRTVAEAAELLGWTPEAVQVELSAAVTVLRATPLLAPEGDQPVRTGPWGADEERRLAHRLAADVPVPPYVPDRADRAVARGRARRRRGLLTAGAGLLVLAALVVPATLTGTDEPEAGAGVATTAGRVLRDLPVPDRCAEDPTDPPAPDLPLDVEQASAVWLRICPVPRPGAGPMLPFAPEVTVVAGVDELVESWVRPRRDTGCTPTGFSPQGATRLQVGTQDGVLHVVDLVLARCGLVQVDGRPLPVTGRTVFADVVGALGDQLLTEVLVTGEPPERDIRCPSDPREPGTADRTTMRDYPRPLGVDLPLPAERGILCRYRDRGLPRLVASVPLGREIAEQLRAAYLARLPRPEAGCAPAGAQGSRPPLAVVLVDATGSSRAFGVEPGVCGLVVGPTTDGVDGTSRAATGRWLMELLAAAPVLPGEFGERLSR